MLPEWKILSHFVQFSANTGLLGHGPRRKQENAVQAHLRPMMDGPTPALDPIILTIWIAKQWAQLYTTGPLGY